MKYCWSFGNDGKSYLYSRELEPYKQAVHMELTAGTLNERYVWHRKAVRELLKLVGDREEGGHRWIEPRPATRTEEDAPHIERTIAINSLPSGNVFQKQNNMEALERAQRLQSLETLQALESKQATDRLSHRTLMNVENLQRQESLKGTEPPRGPECMEVSRMDYREVDIRPGDTVYCDIPYRGTGEEYNAGFDHGAFYRWALSRDFPVFVSEYSMPEGFVRMAVKERRGHLSATNNSARRMEGIFVQAQFKGEVGQLSLFDS